MAKNICLQHTSSSQSDFFFTISQSGNFDVQPQIHQILHQEAHQVPMSSNSYSNAVASLSLLDEVSESELENLNTSNPAVVIPSSNSQSVI